MINIKRCYARKNLTLVRDLLFLEVWEVKIFSWLGTNHWWVCYLYFFLYTSWLLWNRKDYKFSEISLQLFLLSLMFSYCKFDILQKGLFWQWYIIYLFSIVAVKSKSLFWCNTMVWHMLGSCSDAKISLFLFVTVNQLETVSLNSSWSRISFAGLRRRGGISSLDVNQLE